MPASDICVVVASQSSAEVTARCLRSLLKQEIEPGSGPEIIVVEGPPHVCCDTLSIEFAPVKFVRADDCSIPTLHGAGIAESSAALVAITEAHCTFPPDWAKKVLDAHRNNERAAAIGGSVMPGGSLNSLNLGLFLCDYAQFVQPMQCGPSADLPGNNVVFKTSRLGDLQRFKGAGFWKTFFCHELEARGEALYADSDILAFYNRALTPTQITLRRYHHGRCFGAMRGAAAGATSRVVYALTGPLLPFFLLWKLINRCAPKPQCRALLVTGAPSAFFCLIAWSFGEWLGNIIGAGNSCSKL